MIKNLVFKIDKEFDIEKIKRNYNLKLIASSGATTFYENDNMRMSIVNETLVRVLVFDKNNKSLIEDLRENFYGKEYSEIK